MMSGAENWRATMIKDINETIEFYTPGKGLDVRAYIEAEEKQGIHHVGRYQWGAAIVTGRVLDIACGCGFGAKILAASPRVIEVLGVDYDPRAIQYAVENYQQNNLSYLVGNIATWLDESGQPLGQFDCVSSFDTIEHLLHREIALMRIAENLSNDGMLLLSTPCGHSETRLNPEWSHHKIEYSFSDLKKLLGRFFHEVLIPDDGSLPNMSFWRDIINSGKVRYLNRANPIVCRRPVRV